MGCCSSDQQKVQLPKKIQQSKVPAVLNKRSINGSQLFLFGVTSQNNPVCIIFDPITQKIIKQDIPKNYQPTNYSTMNKISKNQFVIAGGVNYNVSEISSKTFLYKADTNQIKQLPSLKQARYTHFSIVFNGFLYLFGGRSYGNDQDAILNNCQKFKIGGDYLDNRQWQKIASMPSKRCTGLAVIYKNLIYVFGGYEGNLKRPQNIQIFDPSTQKWKLNISFKLNVGVQSPIIAPYKQNQFVILGGQNNVGPSAKAITVNLKSQTIKANLKLTKEKVLAKCCRYKSDVFIIGGSEGEIQIEKYNLQSQKSDIIGKINVKDFSETFKAQDLDHLTFSDQSIVIKQSNQNEDVMKVSKQDDIVYIFGTREEPFILEFNISIPQIQYYGVPSSLPLNCYQGGINIEKRKFMIFGGIQDSYTEVSKQTYFYDHETKRVQKWEDMKLPRYAFSWKKVGDFIYALGGGSTNQHGDNQLIFVKQCQRFNLKAKKWEQICSLPQGVISPMSLIFKNNIYLFGGMLKDKKRNTIIHKYLEQTNKWQQLKFKLNFGIQAGAIHQNSQNQFYIFGGRLNNGDSSGIWSITFIGQNGQDCVFQEKGQMDQSKSLHTIYSPKQQDFLIVFGGKNNVVSCYDKQNLKLLQNIDHLRGMEQKLKQGLSKLNQETMRDFTIVLKNN